MTDRLSCPHLADASEQTRLAMHGESHHGAVGHSLDAMLCARCAAKVSALVGELCQVTGTHARSRAGKWFLTPSAAEDMIRVLRLRDDSDESFRYARKALEEVAAKAGYRETDLAGRELWRTPAKHYGLRIVVSYEKRPEGPLPQVVWVGQGRPPDRHWSPR